MFSKRDLRNHLEETSEKAEFIKFQFISTDKFSIQLKCKVDTEAQNYNQHVGEWIKKFSTFTATTWIVRNSFPNRKRMAFRKVFACHRSAFNKKTKANPDRSRNQGCRAKIDFRIKFINKNTIKNDPHLKAGLNLTITIDFVHSHKLWTAESFNLLKSTSETDDIFYSYFNSGYTPTAAKLYHELTLIDRYGDNPECLMNANTNPTSRHVHYINAKFKKTNGENVNFEEIMTAKKAILEADGGYINFDNPEVVIVISPLMRRVISSSTVDHVLVDSALVNGPVVTFIYVPSKAGALPIACVLHAEQNETNYSQAFLAVKLTLENSFNGFEPKVLTVQEGKEIRNAAISIFPNSQILTSKWSLCSKIWEWIFGDDIKIESKKRHNIMELFSKVITAQSLEEAEICYTQLKDDEYVKTLPVICDYADRLWEKRQEWFLRDEPQYMKLVEVSIRLMNEFIYSKCKSFNVFVMIDVITNIVENQIRHILHAHANNADIPRAYTRFLAQSKSAPDTDLTRVGPNEFRLDSDKPRKYIKFRVDIWCCDCANGRRGRFCAHLSSIINTIDTDLMKPCELTDEEKCLFTEIAGGDLEDTKRVKSELNESKMDIEDSDNDQDDNENDDCEEDVDNILDNDDEEKVMTSPKSETNDDDHFFYLDVKSENCEGTDPLEDPTTIDNEDKEHSNSIEDMLSTSKLNLKRRYENAMKCLNNEFRRLNKYFKQNPNKGNMATMVRLASELSKIRPIERVDFTNMQITLNSVSERD